MKAHERIAFALDTDSASEAARLVDLLSPHVGAFKVGLELFIATGALPSLSNKVILDLKLHDIPETVARAVKAGGDLGAKYMTLHVQQRKTLETAVKAAEPFDMVLLGVTVLTSMNDDDCRDLGYVPLQPSTRVLSLAQFGHSCGLRGFVCSPRRSPSSREPSLSPSSSSLASAPPARTLETKSGSEPRLRPSRTARA